MSCGRIWRFPLGLPVKLQRLRWISAYCWQGRVPKYGDEWAASDAINFVDIIALLLFIPNIHRL